MLRLFCSVTNRVAKEGIRTKDCGEVLIWDWPSKQLISSLECKTPVNIKHGRSRGAGGMAIIENTLYTAVRSTILGFDIDSEEEVYRFDPGFIKGYHGICAYNNKLYISCTGSGHPEAYNYLRNVRLILDPKTNDTLWEDTPHTFAPYGCFNAVAFSPQGEEFHMYTGPKEIYNYTTGKTAINLPGFVQAPHDLVFLNEDELLYTASNVRKLVKTNIKTGVAKVIFSADDYVQSWLRGIAVSKDEIFVSGSPSILFVLDRKTEKFIEKIEYPLETNDGFTTPSPFDLLLHPVDWPKTNA